MYDYLIVGSGLFGCVFAHEMAARAVCWGLTSHIADRT